MLKTRQPPRGAFDYLLDGMEDLPKVKADPPPPPPPQEPPRQPRVRVEIELIDSRGRKPAPPARMSFGRAFLVALAATITIMALSQAHGETWTSYKDGFMTRYQSDQGRSGTSYKQGFTTFYEDDAGHHCRSWKQGWQTITECNN